MTQYEELSLDLIDGEVNDAHHTGNFVEIPDNLRNDQVIALLRKAGMVRGRIYYDKLEIDHQYSQIEIRYKGKIALILQKRVLTSP